MQRAALDQGEVSKQVAHVRHVLDAPEQILVAGMVLEHDWRAGRLAVIDQYVDAIAAQRPLILLCDAQHRHRLLAAVLIKEIVDVVDDILDHGIQILQHRRLVAPAPMHVFHQVLHRDPGDIPIQLPDLALALALPTRHLVDDFFQFLLEFLDLFTKRLALSFGQFVELIGRHHFVVIFLRRERHAAIGANQQYALLPGLLVQRLEGLALLFFQVLLQLLAPGPVLLTLERRRQSRLEVFQKLFHVVAQRRTAAGRQCQRRRLATVTEIVDVEPVRRTRLARCAAIQITIDQRTPARTRLAQYIETVTVARHADSETDRFHRPVLSQDPGQVFEFVRGLEIEAGRIAALVERLGLKRLHIGHFGTPAWLRRQSWTIEAVRDLSEINLESGPAETCITTLAGSGKCAESECRTDDAGSLRSPPTRSGERTPRHLQFNFNALLWKLPGSIFAPCQPFRGRRVLDQQGVRCVSGRGFARRLKWTRLNSNVWCGLPTPLPTAPIDN